MTHGELNEHVDEGVVHAWLDGALDDAEAQRVEAHVSSCATCMARVAEARGLIAGASRVLSQLDENPAPLVRPATVARAPESSLWRSMRITPARASIAAMLMVAVGVMMTQRQSTPVSERALDSVAVAKSVSDKPIMAPQPASDPQARQQVAERLATEQPQQTVGRATSVAPITRARSESLGANVAADMGAANQVAAARSSIAAQRDTTMARADRTAAGAATAAPAAAPPVEVAARSAEQRRLRDVVAKSGVAELVVGGVAKGTVGGAAMTRGCYRVDAVSGNGGSWGDAALPFVIALDSTDVVARVLSLKGEDTQARAIVTRSDADSLTFRLRRIGFSGFLALGGAGPERKGFARTLRATDMEQSVTVTARGVACPAP